ncbi:transposase [Streptomyces arenae]|nr:transposase [Streptomyces arenae]MCG7210109.1 transposase [Streptomyces arenae]
MVNRAVLAHRLFTGVSRRHIARLVEELATPWQANLEGRRHAARGGVRKRAAGAGARHQLVFVDRLVATLIHLRHDLPHSVLGLLFGVDRSTITRAIGEIRRLLAERGCAVPDRPGLRLRTLPDVFAYAQAEGIELRLDATEIQVRRPPAGRGGRRAFVSGKKKQNTMKATVIADWRGRTLWTDALRPGRMHDATAARTALEPADESRRAHPARLAGHPRRADPGNRRRAPVEVAPASQADLEATYRSRHARRRSHPADRYLVPGADRFASGTDGR